MKTPMDRGLTSTSRRTGVRPRYAIPIAVALLAWLAPQGRAYSLIGNQWRPGSTVVMQLQLGNASGTLIDGSSSWNTPAENALAVWTPLLNGVTVRVVRDSTAASASGNGFNNVTWGEDVYGEPFGNDTLAVTVGWYRPSDRTFTERDVVFNRKFTWNSYRGNLRNGSGGRLQDLQRVAIHEFGHVFGLDHPDQDGQSVSAVMNSRISNVDTLQRDDIDGLRAIYGGPPAPLAATDTLQPNQRLAAGQALTSTNRRYRLVYQIDGNLVLSDDVDRVVLWSTNTGGTTAGQVLMQGDGNLVLLDGQNVVRWSTGTIGNANAQFVVQNDGNLVIYRDGQPVWDRYRN